MANLHSEYPKNLGEKNLALQLLAMEDPKLHLWFNLNYIPSARDMDVVIWHEDEGCFVIEVKAVPIQMVEEFGINRCRIRDRNTTETPQQQAYSALEYLNRYLYPRMQPLKVPFLVSTACWPLITREKWARTWDDPYISGDLSKRMIFEEDLGAGPDRLKERLKFIRKNPPVRKGADYSWKHHEQQFLKFKGALQITARQKVTPTDLEKLRTIEEKVSKETEKLAPIGKGERILFFGHPGTGKTFRLLQIGMSHALKGQKVLFVCFNKVLASDLSRIIVHSQKLPQSDGELLVTDVFDILRKNAVNLGIESIEEGPDMWGQIIAEHMLTNKEYLNTYDTILIDECQDMKDWALDMISLHSTKVTTFCVAAGTGQELYQTKGIWLNDFKANCTKKELRRNFRNTRPVFQVAQVFYESKMKSEKIDQFVKKFTFKKTKEVQLEFDFDREEGSPPSITYINESALENISETDHFFPQLQHECMVEEYSRMIKEQLERLKTDGNPIDLLVLVPSENSPEHKWVIGALLKCSISFIDYAENINRRNIAAPELVRICTYHSARGLEGYRVLIFGFERIESLCTSVVSDDITNLGYIILSRSIFECLIAIRKASKSRVVPFLTTILDKLHLG